MVDDGAIGGDEVRNGWASGRSNYFGRDSGADESLGVVSKHVQRGSFVRGRPARLAPLGKSKVFLIKLLTDFTSKPHMVFEGKVLQRSCFYK